MKVLVRESFNTKKGVVPAGAVIEIEEKIFPRLQGKVVPIMTEARRKTLGDCADAILQTAVKDIQAGGVWKGSSDVERLEDKITALYRLLTDGLTTLEEFREMVSRWKETGATVH
jgi:hypothetical protein